MAETSQNYAEGTLIYDLRMCFANACGQFLYRIAEAQANRQFQNYYDNLIDLYINVNHKFTEDEKKEWITKTQNAIKIFNNHADTFQGKRRESKSMTELMCVLGALHSWLYEKMDKHNLFGKQYTFGGL